MPNTLHKFTLFMMLVAYVPLLQAQAPFLQPPNTFAIAQPVVHRGSITIAPENTIKALQACVSDFIPWAEVDVRLTKDGKHVLLHDSTLDRTTSGKGKLSDITFEEVQKLDAGAWFGPRFKETKVPTLAEALEYAKGKLNLYLDCKAIDVKLLVQEVLAAGMEQHVVVYGSPELATEVHVASQGKVPVMIKCRPGANMYQLTKEERPDAVEINAEDYTPELGKQLEKVGIRILINCLGKERDNPEVWNRMLQDGQKWIQTDDPAGLLMTAARLKWPKFPVKISCHRGANRYAPENTLPAFKEAMRLGIDYLEMDIRTTKDDQLFIMHDSTINRTTNGKGKVRELTANQLRELDAGSWLGQRWAKTPIPSFDEVLAAFDDKASAYLDSKDISPEALAVMIRKYNLFDRHVVYQSPQFLEKLKQIEPRARAMPPLRQYADLPKVAAIKPYAVDVNWNILSKQLIDDCHQRGILVFSDALGLHETLQHYLQAMEWGIDLIQTDHPLRVLRAIELHQEKR